VDDWTILFVKYVKFSVIFAGVFEYDVTPQPDDNQDRRNYLVENLKPGNIYQFRVAAKNGYNGISPLSYPSGET